jgi:hypothetical protein
LYLDRSTAQFLQPKSSSVAGSDKTLLNDVSAGTDAIQLSDRQGLAVGDVYELTLINLTSLNSLSQGSPNDSAGSANGDYSQSGIDAVAPAQWWSSRRFHRHRHPRPTVDAR